MDFFPIQSFAPIRIGCIFIPILKSLNRAKTNFCLWIIFVLSCFLSRSMFCIDLGKNVLLLTKEGGFLKIHCLWLQERKYYDLKTTPFTSSKNLIKVNGPLAYTAHRHFFFIQWTFKMPLSDKSQIIFKIFLSLLKFFQGTGISGVSTKSGPWQLEHPSFISVST